MESKIDVKGPSLNRIQDATLKQLQQLYLKAEATGQSLEINDHVFENQLNKDVINEALVSLIVVRNLSFSAVEWPEFHALCQALNPKANTVIPSSHSTISTRILEAFQSHKDVVRKKLQSALGHIHLSMDIWTSPNRKLLLGITGDFIECEDVRHTKVLLALRPVRGHSGQDQFHTLLPVLQEYGVVRKIGACIGDGSGTNDTLSRAIQDHLCTEEDFEWKAVEWRTRCLGHIFNRVIHTFLFQKLTSEELESYDHLDEEEELADNEGIAAKFRELGPLGKLHNILIYSRSNDVLIQEFVKLATRLIPLDNRTRWNSWHTCLLVALLYSSAIDAFTKAHWEKLEKDFITPQEWKRLALIKDFLAPFHRATLSTEGHKASLDSVLFTMDILLRWFQVSLVRSPCFFCSLKL